MSGDKLASGAKSASFTSNDGTVTQDKWNDMFKDFDREKFVGSKSEDELPLNPADHAKFYVDAVADPERGARKSIRIYFNCRQDAPNVWSWDEGPGTEEHTVEDVRLVGCDAEFHFDPTKHLPEVSAWIEVEGDVQDCGGKITVYSPECQINLR